MHSSEWGRSVYDSIRFVICEHAYLCLDSIAAFVVCQPAAWWLLIWPVTVSCACYTEKTKRQSSTLVWKGVKGAIAVNCGRTPVQLLWLSITFCIIEQSWETPTTDVCSHISFHNSICHVSSWLQFLQSENKNFEMVFHSKHSPNIQHALFAEGQRGKSLCHLCVCYKSVIDSWSDFVRQSTYFFHLRALIDTSLWSR